MVASSVTASLGTLSHRATRCYPWRVGLVSDVQGLRENARVMAESSHELGGFEIPTGLETPMPYPVKVLSRLRPRLHCCKDTYEGFHSRKVGQAKT